MKCTADYSCGIEAFGMEKRTMKIDIDDLIGEWKENLIRDRLKKDSGFFVSVFAILGVFVILGIVCLVRDCLSWSAVEINLDMLKLRLIQITATWQVCAVYIAILIALVVLMGLHYWFELRMVREHRLSQKAKCDFISQKVDGFRDLLKGAPPKDGTHRYEIVIGRKQDLLTGV